jgi:hypothetical protein
VAAVEEKTIRSVPAARMGSSASKARVHTAAAAIPPTVDPKRTAVAVGAAELWPVGAEESGGGGHESGGEEDGGGGHGAGFFSDGEYPCKSSFAGAGGKDKQKAMAQALIPAPTMERPRVVSVCGTWLKPEMQSIYRQVTGLRRHESVVFTEQVQHGGQFPWDAVVTMTKILVEILVEILAVDPLLVTTHPPQVLLVLVRHQHPPLVQILHVVKPNLGHNLK